MAARVLLREITSEEGNRLLRIVRRTSGSVVTWRRAQIVLLSAQGMSPPKIRISIGRLRLGAFPSSRTTWSPRGWSRTFPTRVCVILDNLSRHLGQQMREWATENNVELAYTPHYASWLNRIEAQFRALRYFTLAGTDHTPTMGRRRTQLSASSR